MQSLFNSTLTDLKFLHAIYDARKIEAEMLNRELTKVSDAITTNTETADKIEKSLLTLQNLLDLKKKETTDKIEALITFGLRRIFSDESYSFKILSKIQRKQVFYEFRVYNEEIPGDAGISILDSRGGGVVNIVSFLLRIIVLLLLDKKASRIFVLDEPFNNVSENYHEALVEVVREFSERLGVQLIVITHQRSLENFGDVVYEFRQDSSGVTTAKKLK